METIEILENSDDGSNDTIIVSPQVKENERFGDAGTAVETELNILLEKYLGDSYSDNAARMNFESQEATGIFSIENAKTHTKVLSPIGESMLITSKEEHSSHDSDDSSNLPSFSEVKKKKKSVDSVAKVPEAPNMITHEGKHISGSGDYEQMKDLKGKQEKDQKSLEREYRREQKIQEREIKKQEKQREAALKEVLQNHYKNLKPENCLKFITTHIDVEIKTKCYWQDIVNEFENAGINFVVGPQKAASSISWTRRMGSYCLDRNVQLIDISKECEIEEVFVIIDSNDFIIKIDEKSFLPYIGTLCATLKGKRIILGIYGLEKYFRYTKSKKREDPSQGETHSNRDSLPVISRRTVEYALTEIQLLHNVAHRMLETKRDMALICLQLTKSIAQIPHKLEKRKIFEQTKWFMAEDNKNCIRVDKNGNGLSRLWKQIITTFPLASLETAEAVYALYSTPSSLMEVYDNVADSVEGEKLLQDLSIRRTAGPISTMRKVGPEFSKKMYHLFTSLDPDRIL